MKRRVIALTAALWLMGSSIFTFGATGYQPLKDIQDHWIAPYQGELYTLQHLGIFGGYSDGTFRPNLSITREEFVKVLVTAMGLSLGTTEGNLSFRDVPQDRWSYPYIAGAVQAGWLMPDAYGEQFEPPKAITREEIAVMMARVLGYTQAETVEATQFLDQEAISPGNSGYIQFAVDQGLIQGYEVAGGKEFRPQQQATRAEAALMVNRLIDKARPLKSTGIYAISSYHQMETMGYFDEIAFGWSSLTQGEKGGVVLSLSSNESSHRIPQGYEIPLEHAQGVKAASTLMITEARREIINQLLDSPQDQQQFVTDVVNTLKEYGFTGVLMDLENLREGNQGYGQKYVALLKLLKEALTPYGYQLTVAVQPRNVVGYFDGYDYRGIGAVADEVLFMAYDYYDRNSVHKATDHAPFDQVMAGLQDLLTEVPKEKVLLGLQIAGGTQVRVNPQGAGTLYTPLMTGIYQALTQRQGVRGFDYRTMTPYFQYTDQVTQEKNEIRFEDAQSLQAKLRLARVYGIKGVSLWRIGEIQPEMETVLEGIR